MELTPLSFPYSFRVVDGERVRTPRYGHRCYNTRCGRFAIAWMSRKWTVFTVNDEWQDWLAGVGLYGAYFPRRREVIEALGDALVGDGLMDERLPDRAGTSG